MTIDANMSDPFYEYEQDLEPAEESRARKIRQLRQAVKAGRYDVDGQLGRLIDNLKEKMTTINQDGNEDEDDAMSV